MNREELIEKAARALAGLEDGQTWADIDSSGHTDRADATAVVDAILPQVTTVAELEALPDGSLLATGARVFKWRRVPALLQSVHDGYDYEVEEVLRFASLTVVWQP